MPNTVSSIARAIEAGANVWYQYLKSRDKIRADRAKDSAEKYMFTNEDNSLNPGKKQKLLARHKKRFFKYN